MIGVSLRDVLATVNPPKAADTIVLYFANGMEIAIPRAEQKTIGKDVARADAWSHVLGVTVGQDISDRVAQFAAKPPHFDLGKSFDTFGPLGPVLVTRDEIPNPNALRIRTVLNGAVMQDWNTDDMIFDVPTLIEYFSAFMTLYPGDLILTGTPDGVVDCRPGDVIVTEIEGVGALVNTITAQG